jgi:hypothetical protein
MSEPRVCAGGVLEGVAVAVDCVLQLGGGEAASRLTVVADCSG